MQNYKTEKIFIASLFSLFFMFVCLMIFAPQTNQHKIFFRETADYMADYHNNVKYSAALNPYVHTDKNLPGPQERIYPPLVYGIFHMLGKAGRGAFLSTTSLTISNLFMFYCSFALLGALLAGYEGKKSYAVLLGAAFVMSGIFIFSYERGNIIILSAACSTFFIFNYRNSNVLVKEAALISLALAAALKLSPALLGLLLLFDKRYKEALRAIIYGAVLIFIPFVLLEGGFSNIPVWVENIRLHIESYNYALYPRFNFRYWAAGFAFMPRLHAALYA
ncbi:MAG: glycosyltransferase 87 family protein, partial [Elusimicrobiota bacterium]|nr:glycosyltransferase 87 family protein [Elusimicrobiota bacterium]